MNFNFSNTVGNVELLSGSKVWQPDECGEHNWVRADNMSVTPILHVTDTHDSSHAGAKVRLELGVETIVRPGQCRGHVTHSE